MTLSRRSRRAPLLAFAAVGLIALRPPFALVRFAAARVRRVVFFADVDRPVIALTLDDGPDPVVTPRVLDVLLEHGARATFFVLGEAARAHPEILSRIVREGHELGNHTERDEPTWRLSADELRTTLSDTHEVLRPFAAVSLFRPGSGWVSEQMLDAAERCGYRCVLGSVYPYDAHIRWGAYVARDVLARIRPGALVVLHEGARRHRIVPVLERVLPALAGRGYTVTTASELIRASETPKPGRGALAPRPPST